LAEWLTILQGLFVGTWRLTDQTVYLENLVEASGKYQITPQDKYSTETTLTIDPACRYVFAMSLSLRSRPLGRWNQMKILSYESVNLETQDAAPVALKHERPYWFSKVRSFPAY
jgi:F-box protein 9